jgi:8-oxo-dGTP pyrophosphatase MutT (NUDIX family)
VSAREAVKRRSLRLFGRLPPVVRRALVRLWAPSYTVGAICVVVDGERTLLVRQSYKAHWGAPGGLLDRGELPDAAAVREVREEVGLEVQPAGAPVPVVWPELRRLDLVFRCTLTPEVSPDRARPESPEIEEVAWFALSDLPRLQTGTAHALRLLGLARPSSGS